MLGDEAYVQHPPEPQNHIGDFGAERAGTRDLDGRERDLRFALAYELGAVEHRVAEMAMRERGKIMIAAAGIEHVGHQHDVVECRERSAVTREHQRVLLEAVTDLEHAGIFEQRLEQIERVAFVDLAGSDASLGEQVGAGTMAERYVGGPVRSERKRNAEQRRDHRIRRCGDEIDGDEALLGRLSDPLGERAGIADRLIGAAIDFLSGGISRAFAGECRRRSDLATLRSRAPAVCPHGRKAEGHLADGIHLGRRRRCG